MAKLIIECNPCDQGHYGHTTYHCSECHKDCKEHVDKCPYCGVVFDEESDFKIGSGFGGNEFM